MNSIKHQIIPKPHPQISKYFFTCSSKNENIYKPDPDINQNIHIPDPDNNMDSLGRWLTPIHSHCLFSLAISPWTRIFGYFREFYMVFTFMWYLCHMYRMFKQYLQHLQSSLYSHCPPVTEPGPGIRKNVIILIFYGWANLLMCSNWATWHNITESS